MRDLGISETGVFRRRPNAQYHSIGPSAAYVAGWVVGCMAERVVEGGRATRCPTLCIGLGQQGRSCYSIAVATKRPS